MNEEDFNKLDYSISSNQIEWSKISSNASYSGLYPDHRAGLIFYLTNLSNKTFMNHQIKLGRGAIGIDADKKSFMYNYETCFGTSPWSLFTLKKDFINHNYIHEEEVK